MTEQSKYKALSDDSTVIAIMEYCEYLLSNTKAKKLFIDPVGQDYIIYQRSTKNGKPVLIKRYDLHTDGVNLTGIGDISGNFGEYGEKILHMVDTILSRQETLQAREVAQGAKKQATKNHHQNVR